MNDIDWSEVRKLAETKWEMQYPVPKSLDQIAMKNMWRNFILKGSKGKKTFKS